MERQNWHLTAELFKKLVIRGGPTSIVVVNETCSMEQRRHGLMRNPDILVGNAFQAPTFTSAYKNSFDRFLNGRTFVTLVASEASNDVNL